MKGFQKTRQKECLDTVMDQCGKAVTDTINGLVPVTFYETCWAQSTRRMF